MVTGVGGYKIEDHRATDFNHKKAPLKRTDGTYKRIIDMNKRAFILASKSTLWLALLFLATAAMAQTKLYVDVNASGSNNGSSWANAYVDLQDALDAHMSTNVDEILIAEGTYKPTSAPDGSTTDTRNRAFHLANDDVLIAGGYDPSTGNQTGNATILTGDNVSANTVVDNCYHVFVLYNLTNASSINNITITKGRANGTGNMTYMSQTINRIDGAGVYSKSCSAGFNNVVFTANKANYYGGGMFAHTSSSSFVNVVFYKDTSNTSGGAYANTASTSDPTFTNTLFAQNKSFYGGAIVNTGGADITLVNASFFENTGNIGGAVFAQNGCDLALKNTFFYKNSAGAGKDIETTGTLNASNTNNATYQGTSGYLDLSSYAYEDLFADYTSLVGTDGIWMTSDDGLVPAAGSALLKAGTTIGTPPLDINGSTRPAARSIGAYDFPAPEARTVTANKITFTSANLNCLVNPNNYATSITFEYGTTTSYGSSVSVSGTITGSSTQFISKEISGLAPGQGYHYRVKAQNTFATTYGDDRYFIAGGVNTLDAGLNHSIVLTSNGLVQTFGDNTYGQLGDNGASTSSGVPLKVLKGAYSGTTYLGDNPGNPIIAVSAGDNYNLALAADGTVFAWGDYTNGQLGAGSIATNAVVPVQVLKGAYSGTTYLGDDSDNPIIAISAGINHNLVLTANGEVLAFGNNSNGKQGDNSTTTHNVPVQVLKGAYNGTAYLGDDTHNPIIAVSAGTNHSLTLGANGMVYSFGNNGSGRLGNGNGTQQKLPVLMVAGDYGSSGSIGESTANPVIAISAGNDHSIALTANGRVYSCGYNGYGALGTGNNTGHSSPAAMITGTYSASLTYMGEDPNNPIVAILAGYQNTFVSTLEGEIHTMGYSPYGGNGVIGAYKFTPLTVVNGAYGTSSSFIGDVSTNPVIAMAKGKSHSLVATKDGFIYAFGSIANGKLGNPGVIASTYFPALISKLGMIQSIIQNSGSTSASEQELTLASAQNSGYALQNPGDFISFWSTGDAVETTADIPSGTNVSKRSARTWSLSFNDVNSNGGLLDMTFSLTQTPVSDYSYYLLERIGTSGDFAVINDLNYSLSGNTVTFRVNLSDLSDGSYYTVGRSEEGAGYCLDFDGSNDRIDAGSNVEELVEGNSITFECWIKGHKKGDRICATKNLKINTDKIQYGGSNTYTYTDSINDGKWHHIAVAVRCGQKIDVYIDGALEYTHTSSSVMRFDDENYEYLFLGPIEGQMDEVRIWNIVRTEAQIKKNMHRTLVGNESGLKTYYKFDQSSDAYLPDVSRKSQQAQLKYFALTGTTSNWVESTAPVGSAANALKLAGPGNALDFDASNDRVKLTNLKLDPDNGNGFSAEAWIKPTISSTAVHIMLSQQDGTGKGRTLFSINKDGKLSSYINGSFKIGSSVLTSGEWAHVALVYNGTQVKMYLNGILDGTFSSGADAADGSWVVGSGKIGATSVFDGLIDDLRIWADERTQTEIQDNMYTSLNGDEAGLEAYYHFDHTTGSVLEDQTSNGYDGTLTNFSGTYWVSAADREPFKTVRSGPHNTGTTWKDGTAPSTSTDKLAVFHDLTLGSTGTYSRLQVNSGNSITTNADVTITGEVIVNGTANGTNKIILGGASKQSLGGSGTLGALQINNSNDVSLEGDLTIAGTLTLTSGDIEVNDNTLILSGSTSHGSSTSYLKINGSGQVKATVGSDPVILPIGRNPYLPIIIDDGGGAEYTVGVADKVYANPVTQSTEQTGDVVSETWTIQSSSAASDVIVTIQWEGAEEEIGFDRTASRLVFWENGVSSQWDPGSVQTASGSGPYSLSRTADLTTNQYYFGVGSRGSQLPVELTYFNAQWIASTPISNPLDLDTERSRSDQSRSAQLTWETSVEENNSHFEIQRAIGTLSGAGGWQTIGTVQGQGTSFSPTQYSFIDNLETVNSIPETIYYRLKQVDFSGQFEYSDVRTLNIDSKTTNSLEVWPNPSTDDQINLNQVDNYEIRTLMGQLIIQEENTNSLNISTLSPGTYVITNAQGQTTRFVKH